MPNNTPYEGTSKHLLLLCTTNTSWCTRKQQYHALGIKKGNSKWYTYEYINDVHECCTLTVEDIHNTFKIVTLSDKPLPRALTEQGICNILKEDTPQSISGADIAKLISKANPVKIKPHPIYPLLQPRANVFDEYSLAMGQPMNAVSAPPSANPINIQPGSIKQSYRGI